jgi:hypothetical protein
MCGDRVPGWQPPRHDGYRRSGRRTMSSRRGGHAESAHPRMPGRGSSSSSRSGSGSRPVSGSRSPAVPQARRRPRGGTFRRPTGVSIRRSPPPTSTGRARRRPQVPAVLPRARLPSASPTRDRHTGVASAVLRVVLQRALFLVLCLRRETSRAIGCGLPEPNLTLPNVTKQGARSLLIRRSLVRIQLGAPSALAWQGQIRSSGRTTSFPVSPSTER